MQFLFCSTVVPLCNFSKFVDSENNGVCGGGGVCSEYKMFQNLASATSQQKVLGTSRHKMYRTPFEYQSSIDENLQELSTRLQASMQLCH